MKLFIIAAIALSVTGAASAAQFKLNPGGSMAGSSGPTLTPHAVGTVVTGPLKVTSVQVAGLQKRTVGGQLQANYNGKWMNLVASGAGNYTLVASGAGN